MYVRVSSADQREDLERQVGRLAVFAAREKLAVMQAIAEVGSALNGARPRLRRLLADASVGMIVVEHRGRLARFGFDYLASAIAAQGWRIVVMDDGEVADDLVRDMTEVLTSFCARLYGERAAAARARRALQCAREELS